jgi:inner membrane protein involved in colicin E2 resistance
MARKIEIKRSIGFLTLKAFRKYMLEDINNLAILEVRRAVIFFNFDTIFYASLLSLSHHTAPSASASTSASSCV